MRRYTFHNVSLAVPPAWLDLSIITLAGEGELLAPTLVITREDAPAEPIAEYAKRQSKDLARELKGYKPLSVREQLVAGKQGARIEHSFLTPERVLARQRQYYVIAEREVLVFTLTAAEKELARHEPTFKDVLDSLEIE